MGTRTKRRAHGTSARKEQDHARSGATKTRSRVMGRPRLVVFLSLILAAVCACDVQQNELIAECTEYAAKVRACFGDRAGDSVATSFVKPPTEERARAALMARCARGSAEITRSCR